MAAPLVILGASSRAAAQSAVGAGFSPYCADLFADVDLVRLCRAHGGAARRSVHWPHGLAELAEGFPAGPWLYTGGLENHSNTVERVAAGRMLYGNRGDALRFARDPVAWTRLLTSAGLPCPQCAADPAGLPRDGSWLRKGRRSSGGALVQRWAESSRRDATHAADYFQQFISGLSASAAYVAAAGQSRLIGLSEQLLVGDDAGHHFRYAGSVGPLPLSAELSNSLAHLGDVLAKETGLVGLFGVDGIVADGAFWPVEINPRYTASMELHEHALRASLVGWHVDACATHRLPEPPPRTDPRWHAKRILFAPRQLMIPNGLETMLADLDKSAPIADVPHPGTRIAAGHPVLTVFATGPDREAALDSLAQRERAITAMLTLDRC